MAHAATFTGLAAPRCARGAPRGGRTRLADLLLGARGALRAGREIERLRALSDAALAREGMTREGIVSHALRLHLGD